MSIDKDDDQSSNDLETAAAFESSFQGTTEAPAEKPAQQEEQTTQPEVKPEPVEAAPAAPTPADNEMKAEMRKLHGRIGALNDQLQQALKSKEAEGKPAVLSTVQLKRMREEFPEMAEMLEGDIAESMKVIGGNVDPKQVEDMVSQRVEKEIFTLRQEAITERHENWKQDCWVDKPGGEPTPDYQEWLKTMTDDEVSTLQSSMSPAFVNRKLDQFYEWKSKKTKTEAEKQQRLKAALTPQGVARAGSQTTSDEEAERKAFEDAYNG